MKYTSKRAYLLEINTENEEILVNIDGDEKKLKLERVPNEEWIVKHIGKEVDLTLRDETVVQIIDVA